MQEEDKRSGTEVCLKEIRLLRRRLLIQVKLKMDENMNNLFFNGEFTSKGNFRGEDVYKFLKDLKLKMELQEVPEVGKIGFLHRH